MADIVTRGLNPGINAKQNKNAVGTIAIIFSARVVGPLMKPFKTIHPADSTSISHPDRAYLRHANAAVVVSPDSCPPLSLRTSIRGYNTGRPQGGLLVKCCRA